MFFQHVNAKPPAVVQTAQPRTVKIPIDIVFDFERVKDVGTLVSCLNFYTPHKTGVGGKAATQKILSKAKECVAQVEKAVVNGTISDAPALTLALRSIPFTSAEGGDNVADTATDIATQIAGSSNGAAFIDYHLAGVSTALINKPFTDKEVDVAIINDGRIATPDMLPSRVIPIDASTSYIMTAADVVMHPDRYTAEGKTLAETVADARTRHSVTDDKELAKLCMINSSDVGVRDCQGVSARNTAEMIVNGKAAPYDPSLYTRKLAVQGR